MTDIPPSPGEAERTPARGRSIFRSRRFQAAAAAITGLATLFTVWLTRPNSNSAARNATPHVACTPSAPQAESGTLALNPYGSLQTSTRNPHTTHSSTDEIQEFASAGYEGDARMETRTTRPHAANNAPMWAEMGVDRPTQGSPGLFADMRVNAGPCINDFADSLAVTANGVPIADSTMTVPVHGHRIPSTRSDTVGGIQMTQAKPCTELPLGPVTVVFTAHARDGQTMIATELLNNSAGDCMVAAPLSARETSHIMATPQLRSAHARLQANSHEITMQVVGNGPKPDQVTVSYETAAGPRSQIHLGDCKTLSLKIERLRDGWQAALTVEVPLSVIRTGALLIFAPGRGLFATSAELTTPQSAQYLLSPGGKTLTRTQLMLGVSSSDFAASMAPTPSRTLAPAG